MKDFTPFRRNVIGIDRVADFPAGKFPILYADWTASGRLYGPIERFMTETVGPYVANTHTETTLTGTLMTDLYHQAQHHIKEHVHAGPGDVILFAGFGMTAVVNKLQRLLGLRLPEKYCHKKQCGEKHPTLVIVTHMEHHSNQTTWLECCCDVEIVRRGDDGLPDLGHLEEILAANRDRELLIGSFSACSNVTGIRTPYHRMAEIMHRHGGYCFVDFAASAPYVDIDMHPAQPDQKLDAIFFSPHKFLGGPGASGVLVMDRGLYRNEVPDQPGGGTVLWTNPWGEHHYYENIEVREDGGTPGFLQAIRASLAIRLKETMGPAAIQEREEHLKDLLIEGLSRHPEIAILEPGQKDRLGIVSFYSLHRHHNLIVRLLNDRFGIQTRGGCSCAGTYGHILLHVDRQRSQAITEKINHGDLTDKPGWVRISLHPVLNEAEVELITSAVGQVLAHYDEWGQDYQFHPDSAEFVHRSYRTRTIDLNRDFPVV